VPETASAQASKTSKTSNTSNTSKTSNTSSAPPSSVRDTTAGGGSHRLLVRVAFPAPAPASAAPATSLEGVALLTLDRPEVLNALDFDLLDELAAALEALDRDAGCRAVVITGAGDRAFAAGADIGELANQNSTSLAAGGRFGAWDRIAAVGLPVIAAVRGFALGGGCELAMACDMIVAADDAQFGQPEIRIGVMPGAGGTQRMTRAIGKARAMELILTGRTMTAREAETYGLVTRLVPAEATVDAALELAARVAAMPPLAVRSAKAALLDAAERDLAGGFARERAAFFDLFDTDDQAEGMAAFTEKRRPMWSGH
jgi:enoyl-CoA hydratase